MSNDKPLKNGDASNENEKPSTEKFSIKRNNEDQGTNRNYEHNNSDDESRDVHNEKWSDAKRRRESSPSNIKYRKSPIDEGQDHKRLHGKLN